MFRRNQKEIDNLNARCVELAKMVKDKDEELKIQRHNNELIMQENERINNENISLKYGIEELIDRLKRINLLMTCNQYENDQVIRNKIIELTNDWKSNC